ncbi:engulfment and cell motility protein 3 isoform X2 [Tyto alba]|nr:engulfment and cell motility protein 3 isoform X2 [Tyto alba]
MRATQEDFDKVLQVVREQITRTLSLKPTSLELFKTRVNALNYSEILKLRQTERLHQEETLAVPVLELRERLKPELLELIRQQRLLHLCEGTLFRKISSRRRQDKLWYCRLSPNHKVLHYGDVEEGVHSLPIESLPEKIPVADMKMLLVGKECPHTKEKSSGKQNKDVLELAFSIVYDVEEYCLNFVAPTRYEFCLWTDGLNVLLGKEMTSERTQTDLDVLLSMELKLRLLDLENISIPDTPPPVPKPPSNLNFCYDFSQAEHLGDPFWPRKGLEKGENTLSAHLDEQAASPEDGVPAQPDLCHTETFFCAPSPGRGVFRVQAPSPSALSAGLGLAAAVPGVRRRLVPTLGALRGYLHTPAMLLHYCNTTKLPPVPSPHTSLCLQLLPGVSRGQPQPPGPWGGSHCASASRLLGQ